MYGVSESAVYAFTKRHGIKREAAEPVECTKKMIKKCAYGNTNGVPSCDYLAITGNMRPCDPEKCTEFTVKR